VRRAPPCARPALPFRSPPSSSSSSSQAPVGHCQQSIGIEAPVGQQLPAQLMSADEGRVCRMMVWGSGRSKLQCSRTHSDAGMKNDWGERLGGLLGQERMNHELYLKFRFPLTCMWMAQICSWMLWSLRNLLRANCPCVVDAQLCNVFISGVRGGCGVV